MSSFFRTERFPTPVVLADGVYCAVSEPLRGGSGVGLAFLVEHAEVALIGLPDAEPEAVVAAVAAAVPGAEIVRIVVLEWDDRLLEILTRYAPLAPKARVVAERRVAAALRADAPLPLLEVVGSTDLLTLAGGRTIGFVPSPFVFTPSALMVFDHRSRVLFTNRLFETPWETAVPASTEAETAAMREYHRQYAPSSDYLRPVLADVLRIAPAKAVTRSGRTLDAVRLKAAAEDLSRLEFFNAPRILGRPDPKREVPYGQLATQVVFKFAAAYGESAVLETFAESGFTVTPRTYEIAGDGADDFRVWQRLFDIVYARRGSSWLVLVEPLVDRLSTLYGIAKPAVYGSGLAAAEQKAVVADAAARELEARIARLEADLGATLDKLARDPQTGVYNERFLRAFLAGTTAGEDRRADAAVLLFIAVDDLARIIARYTRPVADQTIRNLGYLLDRIRRPGDLVCKRVGRGYAVVIADGGMTTVSEVLTRIREGVRDADAFIESITVAAALVRVAEFPRDLRGERLADAILAAGENRLRAALENGPSAFVDERVDIAPVRAGRILLVDDDPTALALLAALLRSDNYDVVVAADGAAALEAGKARSFDVVVCERNVPKIDGFTLRAELYAAGVAAPRLFILMTYAKTRETVVRANQSEIDYVLAKPVVYEELYGIIRRMAVRERIAR